MMGACCRELALLWALALTLACAQHTGRAHDASPDHSFEDHPDVPPSQQQAGGPLLGVTVVPPLRTIPVVRALNPAHNGRVCSTWGDFHYKTFDGAMFRFPGLCNYVFSAHCRAAYEDFNVQIRRGPEPGAHTLTQVTMKLDGLVVELTNGSILVNSHRVRLPFSQAGVLIERSSVHLKVVAKLGLLLMWNQDGSLLLELDDKFANQTCGLCGDFNGLPDADEFLAHDVKLTPTEFGNLQKLDGPTEQCPDPKPVTLSNCLSPSTLCEEAFGSLLFSDCRALLDAGRYLEACRQDLCLCKHADPARCLCHTLAEYSRQCAHAGGLPPDWRTPDLCPQTCPLHMQFRECGSPCADTCSNLEHSQLCEDHCIAGCFCPEGTVLDDIGLGGCVPVSQCPCIYKGVTYAPGDTYSTDCTNCTCSGGRWSCQEAPCPGTCSVLGGSHISTFDEKQYTVHGDCSYVLAKPCDSGSLTVLGELRRCGLTDGETCLKSVTLSLSGGQTVIVIKASGEVFVNQIYTQLPISAANVTIFRPSTFFVIAHTNLGLQLDVQLVPTMQAFVRLVPELQGLTCGLCGNFNQNQADDFRTISGLVEGTSAAFANTWKTQAACPNVKNSFEDPCSLSVENEKYAQHWCSRLADPKGPFAQCHAAVNPDTYYSNCLFDTCNCERSEDCLCAALSAYVRACAARGILLSGWRDGVCMNSTISCPKTLTYQEHIHTCQPTCRSLSEADVTCSISFIPVDGCTCAKGTFLDEWGKCVPASSCPCYYHGSVVLNGETLHDSGAICTCTRGVLTCIGGEETDPVCADPMVYFDCRNATAGTTGAGCQKSCHTLDMACYSPQCVPGCVCPDGLVSDGKGGCITEADCPCVHNEASYAAGQTILVGCNTCTCKSRMWHCTDEPCLATCTVYGDGHYLTFDGQRYSFSGDCEYTLVQDHCGGSSSPQDSFHVVTENVPCGTTGTTCSKAIKIFLGSYELKLSDGKVEVVEKGAGQQAPYTLRQMGIYLVVDTNTGLVLLWDKKTSIFIKLSPTFKGKVCGLCGNFDDNAANDFTTRSRSVVGDVLEFGNSWKFSPTCPDALAPRDPCTANPYRKSWAQKQCSIINSSPFAACRAQVESTKYYEACVSDACACDSGGDCECFCTAVAAYAQACRDVGVCVTWRTPDICPLFCDFYNPEGICEWHYQSCGTPCLRTCRNPSGKCLHEVDSLEGCYPKCPPEAPIFEEDTMQCVAECPAPPPHDCLVHGKKYQPGAPVPSAENCQSCVCTENGVRCVHDTKACICTYDGQQFHPGNVIYHTTDGMGGCISARCGTNGTIERRVSACDLTTPAPPTTFVFSTPTVVLSSTSPPATGPSLAGSTLHTRLPSRAPLVPPGTTLTASAPPTTTSPDCGQVCRWSPWLDVSHPGQGPDSGDFDTLENLRAHGYRVCKAPRAVECRAEDAPDMPLRALKQRVECSTAVGLICYNRDQMSGLCDNYQIRIQCCTPESCSTSSGPSQTTPSTTSGTIKTGATPGTESITPGLEKSTASQGPFTAPPITTGLTSLSTGSSTSVSRPVPGTSIPLQSRPTLFPGTSTPVPGTSTPVPGTLTPVPGTLTPISGTQTPVPGTPTPIKTTLSTPSPLPVLTTLMPSSSGSTTAPGTWTHTGELSTSETTMISCFQEICTWTKWIDGSYPASGINGGDFDTFHNLRSKGYKFCDNPKNVECRAVHFPDTPLAELEQHVICSKTEGLLCLNKDQLPPICYNYEIRILCCEMVDMCRVPTMTTASPKTKHSTKHKSKTTTQTTRTTDFPSVTTKHASSNTLRRQTAKTSTPSKYVTSPLGHATTTNHVPTITDIPVTTTPISASTNKIPLPMTTTTTTHLRITTNITRSPTSPTTSSGPTTTTTGLSNITTSPSPTTTGPSNITTRLSTSTTGPSTITTSPTTSNSGPSTITDSPSTSTTGPSTITTSPSTTTTGPSTITTIPSTTTSGPSPTSPGPSTTAPGPSSTPNPVPLTTTTSVTLSTSSPPETTVSVPGTNISDTTPGTTHCQPRCTWTKWFDVDFPSPGPHGGDMETYSNIVRRGEKICRQPEVITQLECQAENHPEVSIDQLGQVVECNRDLGLVCRNQDQVGKFKMCLNYKVRVLCCEPQEGCPVTGVTIMHNSTEAVTSQTTSTTSEATTSTSGPSTTTTGPSTITTSPSTSTTGPSTITTSPSNSITSPSTIATSPSNSTTSPSTITTSPSTPTSGPSPTAPGHSTTVPGPSSTPTPVPLTTTTSVSLSISSPPETTVSVPGTSISVTTPGTTHCQPRCSWTKWFDVDFPSPGMHGGDMETYSNIVRRGEKICRQPEVITRLECRAENHPEVSIDQLGQVVECNRDVGLVCRNPEQVGKFKMCLNYEVRVLCCEPQEGCPVTGVTIMHTSTEAVTSQTTSMTSEATTSTSGPSTTTTGPSTSTTSRSTTTSGPSTTTTGPSTTTTSPSTSTTGPSTITTSPSTSTTGPSTITSSPSTSITGPSTIITSPSTSTTGPSTITTSPSTSTTGPSTITTSPSTSITGPSTIATSPSTSNTSPSTITTSPSTSITGPSTITTSPSTSSTGPSTITTSPSTSTTGPSTITTSPSPSITGPSTIATSPSTSTTSPSTITTSPSTSTTGPSTITIRPSTSTTGPSTITTSPSTSTTGPSTITTSPSTSITGPSTIATSPSTSTTSPSTITTSPSTPTSGPSPTAPGPSTTAPGPSSTPTPVPLTTTTSVSLSTSSAPETTVSVPGTSISDTTPGTTHCQPRCSWTKWFDVDFPSPGPHGGDMETYSNIVTRGEKICRQPEVITRLECRAENHPEVSIDQLGQVVECNRDVGLVCRNPDQVGKFKMCLNYEVRVLCCEPQEGCPVTGVTIIHTSTEAVTSQTTSAMSEATTTTSGPSTTTTGPSTITSSPSTSITGPSTITTSPSTSITGPSTITTSPSTSTTGPSTITTSPSTSTTGPSTIATSASTSTTGPSTITTRPSTSTSAPSPTTPGPSTTALGPSSTPTPVPLTTITSVSLSTSSPPETTVSVPGTSISDTTPGTSHCQPRCSWTKWFDVDFPSPGPHGGDMETYSNIVRRGEKICRQPEVITQLECRAENHPEVSIDQLGQVVECNRDVGLVCRNPDQVGKFKMCLNYEVRVLCCEPQEGCPVTGVTIIHTSTEAVTSQTTSAMSEATTSTSGPSTTTTGPSTITSSPSTSITGPSTITTSPSTSTTGPSTITTSPSTSTTGPSTITNSPSTSTTGPSTITTSPSTTTTGPSTITTIPSTTTSGPSPTSPGPSTTAPGPSSTPNPDPLTTTTSVTLSTSSPPETTVSVPGTNISDTTPGTTHCQPRCSWTKWFDVDFPSPGPHGGDMETYSNIVRRGEKICRQPEVITRLECRAENHPEVSIDQLGQVVECNRDVGLVCLNQDQVGKFKMCLNYKVRVLCCEPQEGCPVTGVTIMHTSTEAVTSQTTSMKSEATTSTSGTSTTTTGPSTITTSPSISITGPSTITTSPSTSTTGPSTITTSPSTSTTGPSTIATSASTSTTGPSTITTRPSTSTSGPSPTTPGPSTTAPGPSSTPTPVPLTTITSVSLSTSSPPETTVSVPGTNISDTTPGTTHCQPRCSWTKWFDVDFPSPGPHGGDMETYSNIVRRGEKICRQPEVITRLECRAENHPEVSIDQLGQVVECKRDMGLVCQNQDQVGKFKMCLNYEVRVLCCEPQEGCPFTGVTPHVTLPSSVSPQEPTSVSGITSTTVCYCLVSDHLYPAGAVIYRQIDLSGHCYYAICSPDCEVIRHVDKDCPLTSPPPTSGTTLPASPVSSSHTSVPSGCPDVDPPRMKGETWTMHNCTLATCQGDNIITLSLRKCPQMKEPTCANGYPAVQVAGEDGCCTQYQCQCVCSGWGDPHYITFDGTYYTFLDNCTYVLVQQIVPVYGHFRVLIDNYFCDSEDGLSCPQSIIVEYQQDRVVLTRRPVDGVMTNEIIFDDKVVSPGFTENGIVTFQLGIDMYVTIPKIGVQVMFSGLIFSVKVPFSKFNNNTEGQCGTCTNDQRDECRLPGGKLATSCSEMSGHWKVPIPSQPFCNRPSPPPTTVGPTSPPTQCLPLPICQLILSEVFEACHAVIPPWPYYEGCLFDQCHMTDPQVVCSALELYASLCLSEGVCIDWRGRTNDTCPFTCPAGKEYLPCGPVNLPYCYGGDNTSLLVLHEAGTTTEGCFCPQGMMLFSSSMEVCVPTSCPSCLGPNGEPVEPGHTVSSQCQECTCDRATRTMICWTPACPLPPACSGQGLILHFTPLQPGECCPQYSCVCNTSYCPQPKDVCPRGSHVVLTHKEGSCCPSYTCSPGCSINSTFYQPGAVVSSDPCGTCWCEADGSPLLDTYMVKCDMQICDRQCPAGSEYQVQSGQCCGRCVQVACVLETGNSSIQLLYPGESWSGDRCVTHECEKYGDRLAVVTIKKACPTLRCPRDQAKLSEDGCCLFCPPQNRSACAVHHKHEVIWQHDCSSLEPVHLTYCGGNCGDTASTFSFDANMMERQCRCCQELRTSARNVTLHCTDGSSRALSYPLVEECSCVDLQCSPEARPPQKLPSSRPLDSRQPPSGTR